MGPFVVTTQISIPPCIGDSVQSIELGPGMPYRVVAPRFRDTKRSNAVSSCILVTARIAEASRVCGDSLEFALASPLQQSARSTPKRIRDVSRMVGGGSFGNSYRILRGLLEK